MVMPCDGMYKPSVAPQLRPITRYTLPIRITHTPTHGTNTEYTSVKQLSKLVENFVATCHLLNFQVALKVSNLCKYCVSLIHVPASNGELKTKNGQISVLVYW